MVKYSSNVKDYTCIVNVFFSAKLHTGNVGTTKTNVKATD